MTGDPKKTKTANPLLEISYNIAAKILQDALDKGNDLEIPSLKIKIKGKPKEENENK